MQEDTVMIEETDASGNVIGQPIIEKVETTESVTERENRAIQLIVETGLKAKFAILKCGLNLESRSPAYRRIARTAGRSGDLFIYNSWLFNIFSLPSLSTARIKQELQEQEQKKNKRKVNKLTKKVKAYSAREESLRDMRSQLCEAELKLKAEQAARRRAEGRQVV